MSYVQLLTMILEPGGYLQWSEQDYTSQQVVTASPDITKSPFVSLKDELEARSKTTVGRFK